MKRLLLATAVLGTAFAATLGHAGARTDVRAAAGGVIEATYTVDTQAMSIPMKGRVVASRPCRRGRDISVFHFKHGQKNDDGTFRPTGRRGHFHGELEFLYQGGNNDGDVPESGGEINFILKAPRTRPQKDRFHAYNCPRLRSEVRVTIPPDPAAEP